MTKARVNADNASADIQGVTAGTGLTGGGTSGTVTLTNDMATVIDAKGDLVVGTGADTYDNLAAGTNGETLVADSSTSTGLRYQGNFAAGKNVLINGGFDIWQRGTSFSTQPTYTADRWYNYQSASITLSRQSTNPPSGSQYVLRQTATGGSGYLSLHQYIETSNVAALWGKTVTFSIKLRRSSTFDATMFIDIAKTGTVDGGSGATWTQVATTSLAASSITSGTGVSDWTTVSVTAAIPSDGTANGLYVRLGYLTSPANGSYIEAAQAQLEVGSVVTAFARNAGTIQGELSACQRYYWRKTSTTEGRFGFGSAVDSTTGWVTIRNPVTMRANPTSIEFSGVTVSDAVSYTLSVSAMTNSNPTPIDTFVQYTCASGQSARYPAHLNFVNNVGGHFGVNAEL